MMIITKGKNCKQDFGWSFKVPEGLPQFCHTFNIFSLCIQFSIQRTTTYVRGGISRRVFFIRPFLVGGVGTYFEFEDKTYKVEEYEPAQPPIYPCCVVTKWKQV